MKDTKELNKLIDALKALSDSTRFQMLQIISTTGNNLCVNAITNKLDITQPTVSQHLKILKSAGIVEGNRIKNKVHYNINTESILELANQIMVLAEIRNCTTEKCDEKEKRK